MRPIPRALLIHSATLQQAQTDAYGQTTLTTLANLTRVRAETMIESVSDKEGERVERTALLIYDARNSLPAGVTFTAGQRVTLEGIAYRVTAVERCEDGRGLHHVEISLTGETLSAD